MGSSKRYSEAHLLPILCPGQIGHGIGIGGFTVLPRSYPAYVRDQAEIAAVKPAVGKQVAPSGETYADGDRQAVGDGAQSGAVALHLGHLRCAVAFDGCRLLAGAFPAPASPAQLQLQQLLFSQLALRWDRQTRRSGRGHGAAFTAGLRSSCTNGWRPCRRKHPASPAGRCWQRHRSAS